MHSLPWPDTGAAAPSPLDACRDLAVGRLAAMLDSALDRLRPELLRVLDMGLGPEVYYQYMGALELVRDHQQAIVALVAKAYGRHFSQVRRAPSSDVAGATTDRHRLSLLSPEALDEALAVDLLANALRDNAVEALYGLDRRVGSLIDDPDLDRHRNPLGPHVIAHAVMDALAGFHADFKSRLLALTHLSRLLPGPVGELFEELNATLIDRNVLPDLRVGQPVRSGATAHPPAGMMAGDGDLYALFQHYIGRPGALAASRADSAHPNHAVAREVAPTPQPATAILYALNQLQHGQPEALAWSGLAQDALDNGRVNILHGLRDSAMAEANALDAMTLDIVAMVFDYILDDRRMPDACWP